MNSYHQSSRAADPTTLLNPTQAAPSSNITNLEFLQMIAGPALRSQEKYRIPAAVIMAQAALESSWGKSRLFLDAKNPFGIKIKARKLVTGNDVYRRQTTEYVNGKAERVYQNFAKYESFDAAFEAHGELLSQQRYSLFRRATNLREACDALLNCGYATDPDYGKKLHQIIITQSLDDPARVREFAGLGTWDSGLAKENE
jgi:flagellum-specific peptidoglycan hydrolase FlgJ